MQYTQIRRLMSVIVVWVNATAQDAVAGTIGDRVHRGCSNSYFYFHPTMFSRRYEVPSQNPRPGCVCTLN